MRWIGADGQRHLPLPELLLGTVLDEDSLLKIIQILTKLSITYLKTLTGLAQQLLGFLGVLGVVIAEIYRLRLDLRSQSMKRLHGFVPLLARRGVSLEPLLLKYFTDLFLSD